MTTTITVSEDGETAYRYNEIRDRVETGDIFFTASPALFSRGIRLFTHSTVSHCGLFLWIGSRLFVIEALEGTGVTLRLASERFEKPFWIGKAITTKTEEAIIERALAYAGSKYDLPGALLALFWDTKSAQKFCSELVTEVLELNFSHIKRGIFPADVASKCGGLLLVKP